MHVAILHDRITDSDAPDAIDVLRQADAVEKALASLGHTAVRIGCSLDLANLRHSLEQSRAGKVVNLVESIEGKGRLIHLVPFLLDAMDIPYTGACAESMMLTSNKVLAKRLMAASNIPTPPWIVPPGKNSRPSTGTSTTGRTWIIKSVWEHASIGLDDKSIVDRKSDSEIHALLKANAGRLGGACFAEAFIEGREFNLSLLAGDDGPEVLPPAEILFEGFSKEMPKIVDYRAKWDETAYAYHHTPRTFDFSSGDRKLLDRLKHLARRCWECFELSGYARVDFRIDASGNPWVLEVNANPCLSPDAGFAAALDRAGISMTRAMERILEDQ